MITCAAVPILIKSIGYLKNKLQNIAWIAEILRKKII